MKFSYWFEIQCLLFGHISKDTRCISSEVWCQQAKGTVTVYKDWTYCTRCCKQLTVATFTSSTGVEQ